MEDRFSFRVWMMRFWGEEMYEKPSGLMHYFKFGHKNFTIKDVDFEKDVIMQCTGLKDKNGKLIYEGDIVKQINDYSQKIDQIAPVYCGKCANDWSWGIYGTINEALIYHKNTEIIGNIYENPELLEANNENPTN